jgi:hypothetical protein
MHLIPFHGRNRRTAEKKKKSRRSRRGQEEADMMLLTSLAVTHHVFTREIFKKGKQNGHILWQEERTPAIANSLSMQHLHEIDLQETT